MDHQDQIAALVREATAIWEEGGRHGKAGFVAVWSEVRRRLRALRDTATSLAEDEQTALQFLQRLQTHYRPSASDALGD